MSNQTDQIKLAKTSDLEFPQLGFGCCPMGGHGWGKVDPKELRRAVGVALDSGVTLFDTADIYGLGEAERFLGDTLGERRKDAIIATKFGVRRSEEGETFYDNSPSWIRNALELSLKRLKTDYIDIYQIHYFDEKTEVEAIFETLETLRREGSIRYYGVTNFSAHSSKLPPSLPGLVSFQEQFSLAHRDLEKQITSAMKDDGLHFLSWGSMGQGILSGKYKSAEAFDENDRRSREEYVNFYGDRLQKNLQIVQEMKVIAEETSRTLPQIAIRWILDHLGDGTVLVGIKTVEQLRDLTGSSGWKLSEDQLSRLNKISNYS